MNLVVCVKQTPSSEARIVVGSDGRSIDRSTAEFALNPYDEYAMEAALQAKEKFGGELVAISLGAEKAEEALRHCLALGADKAMVVKDPALALGDAYGVAKVLAASIKPLNPDLVLCGKVAIDIENSGTGVALAELLGFPHVTAVSELEWIDEKHCKIQREIEGATEVVEVELPAVLTAEKGLNEPRYPKLPGIMKAKKKPIEEQTAEALGLDASEVGEAGARLAVTKMEPPPPRAEGVKLTGEAAESVRTVLNALRDERKLL
jgi:electron transfer flavoprotein beta subunit